MFAIFCTLLLAQTDSTVPTPSHPGGIKAIAFRPDGKVFATGGWDNTIKIWSKDGNLLRTLSGHKRHITGLSFSDDNKYLASSCGDGSLKIWSATRNQLIRTISGRTSYLSGVEFGDKAEVFASGYDNKIKGWSSQSGKLIHSFTLPSDGYCLSLSSDRKWVAGGGPGGVRVFDIRTGKTIFRWGVAEDTVMDIDFGSNDHSLLVCAGKGRVITFSGNEWREFDATVPDFPWSARWAKDGSQYAVGLGTGAVMLIPVGEGADTTLEWHKTSIESTAFSPDGKRVVVGDSDGYLTLWDANSAALIRICRP
ncbi:MAG: hypothetical protein JST40_06305 [Armatimonadetes bacterium]|nr:hypothetical protein [Armatimonadota bacterium]